MIKFSWEMWWLEMWLEPWNFTTFHNIWDNPVLWVHRLLIGGDWNGLEPWTFIWLSHHIGNVTSQLTHIFQRGRYTSNQRVISLLTIINHHNNHGINHINRIWTSYWKSPWLENIGSPKVPNGFYRCIAVNRAGSGSTTVRQRWNGTWTARFLSLKLQTSAPVACVKWWVWTWKCWVNIPNDS